MIVHNRQQRLVIWVIWFSLFIAVVIYQFALGKGIPTGSDAPREGLNPVVIVAVAQVLIASLIRWLLIPRADLPGKVLVLMIVGLTLSEGVEFYGLFLVPADQPSTKLLLWILALGSVAQFAPVFAQSQDKINPFRAG